MDGKYISGVRMKRPPEGQSWLRGLPAVCHLLRHGLSFSRDVTFFVGENGTGKSTLLEAVAVAYGFNAEGGTKNFQFSTSDTHSDLYQAIALTRSRYARDGFFLRAESFYNVASNMEELDAIPVGRSLFESYGGVSPHKRSHGEGFLDLMLHRFRGDGLYLLDEPEAALSPANQLTALAGIHELVKRNSQFVIATHSPILMAYPGAQIFQFSGRGIEEVPYRQTDHYQLARRFLEDPERMLRYLLEAPPEEQE